MSVLQLETCRLLAQWARTSPKNPVIRSHEESSMRSELHHWLEYRTHTAECRCLTCRPMHEQAAE